MTVYGSTGNPWTLYTVIPLQNKYVSAIYMRSGSWIDSMEFQIYDPSTGTYSTTNHMGGWGGGPTDLNIANIAPSANNFYATYFRGTFVSAHLASWEVGIYYTICGMYLKLIL